MTNFVGDLTTISFQPMSTACTTTSTSYTVIGCLKDATPPPETRETVDASCLGQTDPILQVGAKQPVEFEFTAAWDPGDSEHTSLSTLFDNKCNANWKIQNSEFTSSTGAFTGRIIAMSPQVINRGNIVTRQIRVATSSVVTWS